MADSHLLSTFKQCSQTTSFEDAAVRVDVVTVRFLPNRSSPETGLWTWGYEIRITNVGATRVTLRGRRWDIGFGESTRLTVRGNYVDGNQPTLEPNSEPFTYVSGVPLPAPVGNMRGHFIAETASGDRFNAVTPSFELNIDHPLPDVEPHPTTLNPRSRQDSKLLGDALCAFEAAAKSGVIARIDTSALQEKGFSERARWDVISFFLRQDFNDEKQETIPVPINHLTSTAGYLRIPFTVISYDDIYLTGSIENLQLIILNKRFTLAAQLSLSNLKLDPAVRAEATARLALVLSRLNSGRNLDEVLPKETAVAPSLTLPSSAPKLYADRSTGQSIIDFLQDPEGWGAYTAAGVLTRPDLRRLDPQAERALQNWLRNNQLPKGLNIPTKSSAITAMARAGSVPEPLIPRVGAAIARRRQRADQKQASNTMT